MNKQPSYRVFFSIVAFLALLPMKSQATAVGIGTWDAFKIPMLDIHLPRGVFTGGIYGKGLQIDQIRGNFHGIGNFCNWRVTLELFDLEGRSYYTQKGPIETGCKAAGKSVFWVRKTAKPGKGCVRFFTHGSHHVTSVCHGLY